jgi:hypothetical protein
MKHTHLIGLVLLGLVSLGAAPARAHHVVWLDFSGFDLSAFATVNGRAPTQNDVDMIREQIVTNMVQDYAHFDLYFTESQPNDGRYTQLAIVNDNYTAGSSLCFGCAGPGCGSCPCRYGTCTGIDSWNDGVSYGEVYAGTYAGLVTATTATTATLARGISHSASHELGHILGLDHCDGNDDFESTGNCNYTTDQNVPFHIMPQGSQIGTTARLNNDRFFSVHSSRRVLSRNVQGHGHWSRFRDVTGDGDRDLTYACIADYDTVTWYDAANTGALSFDDPEEFNDNAGNAPDVFLLGDIDGDGLADLLRGRIDGPTTVAWWLRRSTGTSFGPAEKVSNDAGNAGEIFRVGDVDGDGDFELVHGRPQGTSDGAGVTWYVNHFDGVELGPSQNYATSIGEQDSIWLLGDMTGDDVGDLVEVERTPVGAEVRVYPSIGVAFLASSSDVILLGFEPDLVLLGDVDSDNDMDLIFGEQVQTSDTDVTFWVAETTGACLPGLSCIGFPALWQSDGGNAGDYFRAALADAGGRIDLIYGRLSDADSLTATPPDAGILRWFGRLSTGSAFDAATTWADDRGGEGYLFP